MIIFNSEAFPKNQRAALELDGVTPSLQRFGRKVQMVASCKWVFLQLKYLSPWQARETLALAGLDLSLAI